MQRVYSQFQSSLPHLIAAALALSYAWFISQTPFLNTGLQFITPIALIIAVHLLWLACQGRLQAGFANQLYAKATGTAGLMVVVLIAGSLFAPQPAFAAGDGAAEVILMVMFCAAIIAAVVLIGGAALYITFLVLKWVIEVITDIFSKNGSDDDPPQSRLFDIGSLLISGTVITVASLEGLPQGYGFAKQGSATAQHVIAADEVAVWAAMQTATSPSFALPGALGLFPQPVAVSVDEGVTIGSNRVVAFAGREGAGALHLQVVAATNDSVLFEVQSDTTPYATWIGYQTLQYDIASHGETTTLSVTLTYERNLAPAWFFDPLMHGASYLAMDVLARDVKTRSEG